VTSSIGSRGLHLRRRQPVQASTDLTWSVPRLDTRPPTSSILPSATASARQQLVLLTGTYAPTAGPGSMPATRKASAPGSPETAGAVLPPRSTRPGSSSTAHRATPVVLTTTSSHADRPVRTTSASANRGPAVAAGTVFSLSVNTKEPSQLENRRCLRPVSRAPSSSFPGKFGSLAWTARSCTTSCNTNALVQYGFKTAPTSNRDRRFQRQPGQLIAERRMSTLSAIR